MTHVYVRVPFGRDIDACLFFYISYMDPGSPEGFLIEHRYDWEGPDDNGYWVRDDQ